MMSDRMRAAMRDFAEHTDNPEIRRRLAEMEAEADALAAQRTPWDDYRDAGHTWDDYIEARHDQYVARLTPSQRFRRWVWLNDAALWTVGVLLAIVAVLCWVAYG